MMFAASMNGKAGIVRSHIDCHPRGKNNMSSHAPLSDAALNQLFRDARTHNVFDPTPVSDDELKKIFELAKMGPTSANQSPARFVFIRSAEAKAKLKPTLAPGNVDKTMLAPITVLVGYDLEFYQHLPFLMPHANAKAWFEGKPDAILASATMNATLQAGYFILAARALGYDTGPMTGFSAAAADEAFFAGTHTRSLMLINLGHGDATKLFPRSPRFAFDQISSII
jgi:3-hydroxypropanoate dehydrogenase